MTQFVFLWHGQHRPLLLAEMVHRGAIKVIKTT